MQLGLPIAVIPEKCIRAVHVISQYVHGRIRTNSWLLGSRSHIDSFILFRTSCDPVGMPSLHTDELVMPTPLAPLHVQDQKNFLMAGLCSNILVSVEAFACTLGRRCEVISAALPSTDS